MIPESVQKKIDELWAQAKLLDNSDVKRPSAARRRRRSSLHQIIKTPEQAARFMKLLKMSSEEE